VLKRSIAFQLLESIGRRDTEVLQPRGGVEDAKLPERDALHARPQPLDRLTLEEAFGVSTPEALDQARP
jgi:hypothetical protein